jgi:hypothetical protein
MTFKVTEVSANERSTFLLATWLGLAALTAGIGCGQAGSVDEPSEDSLPVTLDDGSGSERTVFLADLSDEERADLEYIATHAIIETSGSDQCDHPLAERTNAWVCPASSPSVSPADTVSIGRSEKASAAAEACSVSGCWDRVGAAEVEFLGQGTYGFGRTRLGNVKFHILINMNGAQSISKPVQFESTRGVRNLIMEGVRLYVSAAYPQGHPVQGKSTHAAYVRKSVAANSQAEWKPNGYKSFENTTTYASIQHTFSWQDVSSGYPGKWFFVVKSPKAEHHVDDKDHKYWFDDVNDLPANWYYSGYLPF